MRFIEWVLPSCAPIDIILDGIINKLHCSMVLCEKGYKKGSYLYNNLNFSLAIELRYCDISFSVVISRKGGSAKASSHYFTLFLHSEKISN